MKRLVIVISIFVAAIAVAPVLSQSFTPESFAGLRARSIGPAVTSGRVMTIAVDPSNKAVIYIGSASGGVWKTVNGGASWQPVFDKEGSFSIGWVTIDAQHPNVVWVGTGERNSQRSVAYGDGVYKSEDGGRSWTNVGLKNSEHIGRIVIHPKDSDTVYVAAQGPLWAAGGDRGLYKTIDGGKTWNQVLKISENTGVSDVVHRSAQSRRDRRVRVPTPPSLLHDDQRRAGERDPSKHRRRQDLEEGEHGAAGRAAWADRIGDLAREPRHPLRQRRSSERQRRHLPLVRQRRHVGEAHRLQPGLDVLRRHLPRSGERRSRVRPRRAVPGVRRRRQDAAPARDSGACTSTTTSSGSIRRTPITCWSATTAACIARSIAAAPGSSSRTCRWPSTTTWISTTRRRSTTSTAGFRTTTRSVGRRARGRSTAS